MIKILLRYYYYKKKTNKNLALRRHPTGVAPFLLSFLKIFFFKNLTYVFFLAFIIMKHTTVVTKTANSKIRAI